MDQEQEHGQCAYIHHNNKKIGCNLPEQPPSFLYRQYACNIPGELDQNTGFRLTESDFQGTGQDPQVKT